MEINEQVKVIVKSLWSSIKVEQRIAGVRGGNSQAIVYAFHNALDAINAPKGDERVSFLEACGINTNE